MTYKYSGNFAPNTLARAEDMADEFRAVEAAIGAKLIRPSDGLVGIDSTWAIDNPTLPQHAVSLGALNERLLSLTMGGTGPLAGYSEAREMLASPNAVMNAAVYNVYTLNMTEPTSVALTCPADDYSHSMTLYVTGANEHALSMLAVIAWVGGVDPVFSGDDVVVFHTVSNGDKWYASVINFNPVEAPSGGGGGGDPTELTYSETVLVDTPLIFWKLHEINETFFFDSSGNARHGLPIFAGRQTKYESNGNGGTTFIEVKSLGYTTGLMGTPTIPWLNRAPLVKGSIGSVLCGVAETAVISVQGASDGSFIASAQRCAGLNVPGAETTLILNGTGLTMECWVRFTNDAPTTGAVAISLQTINGYSELMVRGPAGPQFVMHTTGGYPVATPIAEALTVGAIYHMVAVADPADESLRLYVNGELHSERIGLGGNSASSAELRNVFIGARPVPPTTSPFPYESKLYEKLLGVMSGNIDMFALYDTPLTPERILAHYNAGV